MRYTLFAPVFLVALAAAPASNDGGLEPGQWHVVTMMKADTANGEALSTPHAEREVADGCVSDRDPAHLIYSSAMSECKAYNVTAAKGTIAFTGVCPTDDDGVSLDMSGTGTYSGQHMSLRIDARAESEGNQATMSGTIEATRIGSCIPKTQ